MSSLDKKNLSIRIAVAAIGIPSLLYLAAAGKFYFLILVCIAAAFGTREFSKIAFGNGVKFPALWISVLICILLVSIYLDKIVLVYLLALAGFFIMALLALRAPVELAARTLATSLLGFAYLSLFCFWILIREVSGISSPDYTLGGQWMISLFLMVWSCDTAAYFGGKRLGKHKLAPRISPAKTRAGAAFGLAGALLAAGIIDLLVFDSLGLFNLMLVGLLVGAVGQVGDLVESMLKRSAGLKDTSTLIPGHGGVLDRFDSLLFVAPWVYLYLKWIVFNV